MPIRKLIKGIANVPKAPENCGDTAQAIEEGIANKFPAGFKVNRI